MVRPDLEHFIQLGSENIQGQSQYISSQCVSVPYCPCKKVSPRIQPEPLSFRFMPVVPHPVPTNHREECSRVLTVSSLHGGVAARWPEAVSAPGSTNPTVLMGQLLQPSHLGACLLIFLQCVDVFPVVGGALTGQGKITFKYV